MAPDVCRTRPSPSPRTPWGPAGHQSRLKGEGRVFQRRLMAPRRGRRCGASDRGAGTGSPSPREGKISGSNLGPQGRRTGGNASSRRRRRGWRLGAGARPVAPAVRGANGPKGRCRAGRGALCALARGGPKFIPDIPLPSATSLCLRLPPPDRKVPSGRTGQTRRRGRGRPLEPSARPEGSREPPVLWRREVTGTLLSHVRSSVVKTLTLWGLRLSTSLRTLPCVV